MLRREYGTFQLAHQMHAGETSGFEVLFLFVRGLFTQFFGLVLVLGGWGIYSATEWITTGRKMIEGFHPEQFPEFDPDLWESEIREQFLAYRPNFGNHLIAYGISIDSGSAWVKYGVQLLTETERRYHFSHSYSQESLRQAENYFSAHPDQR